MRQLASIQKITELIPIEGKDRIVLATVEGWHVIVQKSEFSVGDLCVYCEIDSVLPEKPEFEFLRDKKFRIKTMKMAGVLSQGICFAIKSVLPEGNYTEGQDVTEIIGVTKYDPEAAQDAELAEGQAKNTKIKWPKFLMRQAWFRKLVLPKKEAKGFPNFISKTDETRCQNVPWLFTGNDKSEWVVTEKCDGSSGSFAIVYHFPKYFWQKENYEFVVCSRNLRLWNKDNSVYWKVAEKYALNSVLKSILLDYNACGKKYDWVAIQGECIASNIQGNKYKVTEPDFFAFNLITPDGRVGSVDAKEVVGYYDVKFVPIIDQHFILPDSVDKMVEIAHGQSTLGDTLREGLVVRSKDGKQSFKAVDPLFLLKYKE